MPIPVARAAVEAAHAHHQLVFTHATNLTGVEVALTAGVDVLAHTPELTKGIDEALLNRLVRNHLTIIPTLMLFSKDSDIGEIRNVVKRFHDLGGQLMFGTDTGFLTDYNVEPEYQQLYESGLSFRQVLAMLTTIPAQRFGVDRDKGRIRVGMDGDLTILANDPADADPAAMTKVQYTIRHGMVIFDAASVASSE
jgi:imidazolonepropionase-like amidohydrolase